MISIPETKLIYEAKFCVVLIGTLQQDIDLFICHTFCVIIRRITIGACSN
jgi:hypothetical protein